MHFRNWLLALLLLMAAPALADEDKDKAEPMVHATPAMWVVHSPKGTAYLLGSIHALPKNVEWETPAIKAAVKRANAFVFEIPMSSESLSRTGLLMAGNMLLPPSVSLPSYFDAEMRSEFRAAVEHTQIDPEGLVILRPWYAARELEDAMSGRLTTHTEDGVDNKIYAMAQARGVRDVRAFETPEFQLHALKGDANTKNELSLLRIAMKKAATKPMVPAKKLLDAWAAGDPAAIAAIMAAAQSPEERKVILDDRNRNWIPKIEKMLKEKRTFFITVGAAHLVGRNGVPNLLRQAGYRVDGPDVSDEAAAATAPGKEDGEAATRSLRLRPDPDLAAGKS